ncbi:MAG: hypothetical protein NTV32_06865, partial [Gammaproteobacteria bacterium]|nr:hypothetical protein [Gammaproteobacteria bacterium]
MTDEFLAPYRGRYILDSTKLAGLQVNASSEILFYVPEETGVAQAVFIKNCARLKKALHKMPQRCTIPLSESQFLDGITDNGKHTKPPNPLLYASDNLDTLKQQVFAATRAECILHFSGTLQDVHVAIESADAYATQFADAWLAYMDVWFEGKDLTSIQKMPAHQSTKRRAIMEQAIVMQREFQIKRTDGATEYADIFNSLPVFDSKIGPLDALDPLDVQELLSPSSIRQTTPLHLALASKNSAIIEIFMQIISAQKTVSYEEILRKKDQNGKSIENLIDEMGAQSQSLKITLESYCKSTPLSTIPPDSSILSPDTRSRASFISSRGSEGIPFHLPSSFSELAMEMQKEQTEPLAGPYKDKLPELALTAIDFHDEETLTFLLNPRIKQKAQIEIEATYLELINTGQNQEDYPLDLLHLWHLHLEYKFHYLLHQRLHAAPLPTIRSNDDLAKIRMEVFGELGATIADVFHKLDAARKKFFVTQHRQMEPVLQNLYAAFCTRENVLSMRVFDDTKTLTHNIRAHVSLSHILKEKAKEYTFAQFACPSDKHARFLAISIWMQAWQKRRTSENRPLPFIVDMTEYALNKDLACLLDNTHIPLMSVDNFGNNLLHRAFWKNDDTVYSLLLNQDPIEVKAALGALNEFNMSPRNITEYLTMPKALFAILCLEMGFSGESTFSDEDQTLFEQLSRYLPLYPTLTQELLKLVSDLQKYQSKNMEVKATAMRRLGAGNPLTQLYNWLSKKLSGQDQVAIFHHRSATFATLSPTMQWFETHCAPLDPHNLEHASDKFSPKILAHAVALRTAIPGILESPAARGSKVFAPVFSPIMDPRFQVAATLLPILERRSERATPRAAPPTDSDEETVSEYD